MRAAVAAGCVTGGFVLARAVLARPPRAVTGRVRDNYRGRRVPSALGLLLTIPLAFGAAVSAGLVAAGARTGRGAFPSALAGLVMGGLGLVDDLYGNRRAGGFIGHAKALARGRPTTAMLKAAGGGAVGVIAAWTLGQRGPWVIASGATIALAANLANLLDVRPGRTAKAWLACWAALLWAGPGAGSLAVSGGLAGGVLAFLPLDLAERGMLGDAGANLLGAVAGMEAVAALGPRSRLACLAVLVVLTVASEAVSFNRVIERTPVLRDLDRLGRAP